MFLFFSSFSFFSFLLSVDLCLCVYVFMCVSFVAVVFAFASFSLCFFHKKKRLTFFALRICCKKERNEHSESKVSFSKQKRQTKKRNSFQVSPKEVGFKMLSKILCVEFFPVERIAKSTFPEYPLLSNAVRNKVAIVSGGFR